MLLAALWACAPKHPGQVRSAEVAWFSAEGETCGWYRGVPGREPVRMATIPEPCGGSVSFAVLDDDALVQLTRVWRVTPSTGVVTALGVPPVGDLAEVGFDASHLPLAYTVGGGTYADPNRFEGPITFEGKEWPTTSIQEGLPALTHALEWREGGWVKVETKLVSTGWDYAEDQRGLDAHRRLASVASRDLWHEHVGDATRVEVTDLPPPDQEAGEWHAVQTAGGRLAWWMVPVEFLVTTQTVVREAGGRWEPIPFEGWERFDTPSFQTRGREVLVTHWGARPRLIDVATGEVVWSRPEAIGACLWPPPRP